MEDIKIEIVYKVLKTEELSEKDDLLRQITIEAAENSYSPYSKYSVGAAAVLEGGGYVKGNNQENAAYPSGLCAERVALFSAGALFPKAAIYALGVVALREGNIQQSVSICGACRQVLLETEQRYDQDIRVLLFGRYETIIFSSAKDLLPYSFGKKNL